MMRNLPEICRGLGIHHHKPGYVVFNVEPPEFRWNKVPKKWVADGEITFHPLLIEWNEDTITVCLVKEINGDYCHEAFFEFDREWTCRLYRADIPFMATYIFTPGRSNCPGEVLSAEEIQGRAEDFDQHNLAVNAALMHVRAQAVA